MKIPRHESGFEIMEPMQAPNDLDIDWRPKGGVSQIKD
jgi:hypothetical protein